MGKRAVIIFKDFDGIPIEKVYTKQVSISNEEIVILSKEYTFSDKSKAKNIKTKKENVDCNINNTSMISDNGVVSSLLSRASSKKEIDVYKYIPNELIGYKDDIKPEEDSKKEIDVYDYIPNELNINYNVLKTKLFTGKNSMEKMFTYANENRHNFYVAFDHQFGDTMSKGYCSFKTSKRWFERMNKLDDVDKNFYVIVKEDMKCCLFADLEWDLSWKSEIEIIDHINELLSEFVDVGKNKFLSSSSKISNKGSMHLHNNSIHFNNIDDQKRFWNDIHGKISDDWFFIDETEKSYIMKTYIDFGVYNKNRQIRLVYNTKKGKNRPLKPIDCDFGNLVDWTITDIPKLSKLKEVDNFSDDITCTKRRIWSKALVQTILDDNGLDVSVKNFNTNLITLTNKTKRRECPINGEKNLTDNAYATIRNNQLIYKCFDEHCKGKEKVIFTFEDNKEELCDDIPFGKISNVSYTLCKELNNEGNITKEKISDVNKKIKKYIVDVLNKYVVFITGRAKPYYIHRYSINDTITYQQKSSDSLMETYAHKIAYCATAIEDRGRIVGVKASKMDNIIKMYHKSPNKRCYLREDFIPNHEMKAEPNVFNTFTGYDITREKALEHGNKDISKLLDFILNSWCDGEVKLYEWVLDWFAHLIQKPHEKISTSIVLKGTEGTGKGFVIQIIKKIIGKVHFIQPNSQDDILGTFNYLLDNRILAFADEICWGGDKKAAGVLKKLISEEERQSNSKFAVQKTLSNYINWVFATNEQWAIPAGQRARRFTVLEVNQDIYKMDSEEVKELTNTCPYSLAKFLYKRDISNFNGRVSYQTKGLIHQKMMTMSAFHKWIMEMVDNDKFEYESEVSKCWLYDLFTSSQRFRMNSRLFWKEMHAVFGDIIEIKRRDSDGRIRYIKVPKRNTIIRNFNEIFDCEMMPYENEKEE